MDTIIDHVVLTNALKSEIWSENAASAVDVSHDGIHDVLCWKSVRHIAVRSLKHCR